MANTVPASSLEVIKFRRDFVREYVRTSRFKPYTGTGVDNPIVIKQDRGPTVRHPLVTRLKGSGVSGSNTLRGNGESIGNYSFDTFPSYARHAVEFDKENSEKTNLALMSEARPLLMEWAQSSTRDRIIQAMGAVSNGTTYSLFADADETTVKDVWQANNADRILYGADLAHTSGDSSVDLAKLTATDDRLTGSIVSTLRRLAEDADPHIRPIQTDQDSEVFVLFVGSIAHRDLKANLQTLNSNADVRGMKITKGGNILARDGDLFWDGVIVRKVPEITLHYSVTGKPLNAAGNNTTRVEPVFLCGAQALLYGLGQRPMIHVDNEFDYGFQPGVAVELKEDIRKAFFNTKQHGQVTGYVSGVV